jgi:hypothetical protein
MKPATLIAITTLLLLGTIYYFRGNLLPNQFGAGATSEINLAFSSSECNYKISPYKESDLGIKEVDWLNRRTLKVKAYVSINCGEEIAGGNYKLTGKQLLLQYNIPKCTVCMKCMCARELMYEFQNLPKANYSYELVRVGQ